MVLSKIKLSLKFFSFLLLIFLIAQFSGFVDASNVDLSAMGTQGGDGAGGRGSQGGHMFGNPGKFGHDGNFGQFEEGEMSGMEKRFWKGEQSGVEE